jgi:hypothetical protein
LEAHFPSFAFASAAGELCVVGGGNVTSTFPVHSKVTSHVFRRPLLRVVHFRFLLKIIEMINSVRQIAKTYQIMFGSNVSASIVFLCVEFI